VPTYHIEDAAGIDPESGTIHFRRAGVKHVEATQTAWLASDGPVRVGVTAGASTPNNKIGETVARILATRGLVLQAA
jgi:4-hydroxy-3-methylbut-2-enyl diphosphate reductase